MVSYIGSDTFISDSVLFVRDILRNNITDPISGTRPSNEKFVMTSYPREEVRYPLITVTDSNINQIRRLGQGSEKTLIDLGFEVRVWARNMKEKDILSQQVYNFLRSNQFGTGSETTNVGIHDFTMTSMVNVDENGEEAIKSKVMEYRYINVNG